MIPSELIPCCAAPQVYVDLETPSQLWDELRVGVEEYLGSHPEYYSGNCAVFCFGASDPLKLQLGVFFEYSFNGGALSTRRVTGWFGAREKKKKKKNPSGGVLGVFSQGQLQWWGPVSSLWDDHNANFEHVRAHHGCITNLDALEAKLLGPENVVEVWFQVQPAQGPA